MTVNRLATWDQRSYGRVHEATLSIVADPGVDVHHEGARGSLRWRVSDREVLERCRPSSAGRLASGTGCGDLLHHAPSTFNRCVWPPGLARE